MSIDLKPCPFCGGSAYPIFNGAQVCCNDCGAKTRETIADNGEATSASECWNMRETEQVAEQPVSGSPFVRFGDLFEDGGKYECVKTAEQPDELREAALHDKAFADGAKAGWNAALSKNPDTDDYMQRMDKLRDEARSVLASTPKREIVEDNDDEHVKNCPCCNNVFTLQRKYDKLVNDTNLDVKRMAFRLFEYDVTEKLITDEWTWPEHDDDDGYRGDGGWVTIAPKNIQARYLMRAKYALRWRINNNDIEEQGRRGSDAT